MLKKVEKELKKQAKKVCKGDKKCEGAYVYGTLNKIKKQKGK